jgi:hypothetical protein
VRHLRLSFAGLGLCACAGSPTPAAPQWTECFGAEATELLLDGRPVLRTVHDHAKERQAATFKVYTHLFGPAGEGPLTKGDTGGLFPHHKGVFVGWNRVRFRGKQHDFWHGKDGVAQVLVSRAPLATAATATQVLTIRWQLADGTPVLQETRRLEVARLAHGVTVLDVDSTFTSEEQVVLDGDPHHAGCHVRLAQEVAEHEKDTALLLPESARRTKPDDESILEACPFAGAVVTIGGRRYAVAHFDGPANPRGGLCSVRRYGRIGAFTKATLAPGQPLRLGWRVLLADLDLAPELATAAGVAAHKR